MAVGSTSHLEKFVEPLNQTLKLYEINTCIRKAYFIAQTFLESGEYKFLEELGRVEHLKVYTKEKRDSKL